MNFEPALFRVALQNEDGNPNLVVIELRSGRMTQYTFAPTVHGGGYNGMALKSGEVFITASNPNLNSQGCECIRRVGAGPVGRECGRPFQQMPETTLVQARVRIGPHVSSSRKVNSMPSLRESAEDSFEPHGTSD